MKQKYHVNDNPQPNGDYEVHTSTCTFFPMMYNRTYLGEFEFCHEAIREAKKQHYTANGCIHCCRPCHTT